MTKEERAGNENSIKLTKGTKPRKKANAVSKNIYRKSRGKGGADARLAPGTGWIGGSGIKNGVTQSADEQRTVPVASVRASPSQPFRTPPNRRRDPAIHRKNEKRPGPLLGPSP